MHQPHPFLISSQSVTRTTNTNTSPLSVHLFYSSTLITWKTQPPVKGGPEHPQGSGSFLFLRPTGCATTANHRHLMPPSSTRCHLKPPNATRITTDYASRLPTLVLLVILKLLTLQGQMSWMIHDTHLSIVSLLHGLVGCVTYAVYSHTVFARLPPQTPPTPDPR